MVVSNCSPKDLERFLLGHISHLMLSSSLLSTKQHVLEMLVRYKEKEALREVSKDAGTRGAEGDQALGSLGHP